MYEQQFAICITPTTLTWYAGCISCVVCIKKLVIGKRGLLKDADYCFHSITRTDQKSSIIELIGAEDDGRKEKAEDDTLLRLGEESSKVTDYSATSIPTTKKEHILVRQIVLPMIVLLA
ncbi:predicted protein [Lichtheimia corymbifera JMRC:FSU:9682]|uniref:Uncharacterized protein n=1 Tax=Lichtheimia corymbifera JMRC:FSU:9682 TaxID=1263082 RepID=A0A068RSJ1_9FUNG|nr:predicted protein [Lichtheimia corymbifera JMRC:FSU:9682]